MTSPTPSARGRLLKGSRKPKNPAAEMTLVEHLQELRKRLFLAVVFVVIGTIVGYIWYGSAPFGWKPLGEVLRGPYCELPPELRASFTQDNECRLLATRPFEMLMLRLKVGALAGLVLSSPFWLYQVWAFVVPGLHKNERRWTYAFVSVAVLLFVSGAVLAYLVMSLGLEFLLGVGGEFQTTALSGGEYYSFFLALLTIFGVSFEVPLLIVMLNLMGILEYATIKGKRRLVAVIIMIFAAFMTPGQDPFSMVVLATSVWLLVELAFQFCRINDKRRGRERPEWMDLDDDAASGSVGSAAPLEAPAPVDAPAPVTPSQATYSRAQHRSQQGVPAGMQPPRGGAQQQAQGLTPEARRADPSSFFDDVL